MTPITTILATRIVIAAVIVLGGLTLQNSQASAGYSARVKMACAGDYFSYCSQHGLGGPAVRQCMSAHGPQLSKSCVNALVAAGEVSASEVSRREAAAGK